MELRFQSHTNHGEVRRDEALELILATNGRTHGTVHSTIPPLKGIQAWIAFKGNPGEW